MDENIYETLGGLELHEQFVYLASQDDVKTQSELLMELLKHMARDSGGSARDEKALMQAFRRVVFDAVVNVRGQNRAEKSLKSADVHIQARRELGRESNIEVVVK